MRFSREAKEEGGDMKVLIVQANERTLGWTMGELNDHLRRIRDALNSQQNKRPHKREKER